MNETWEYIEAYFTQTLSREEKKNFEMRCEKDERFAKDVAFYITARSTVRDLLIEQRQNTNDDVAIKESGKVVPVKKLVLRKWIPYAAAACILLFIALFFLLQPPAPEKMASRYIKKNYSTLQQTMNASQDTLQLGIDAYNSQEYQRAQLLFESIRRTRPASSDAKKFAGLAYLQTKDYAKALECFKELATMKMLYNPGDILAAATLLQRNAPGDKNNAKQLLEKIVRENEVGSDQAKEWLQKW